jgi:tetratricopeptide (TPR) repeat protein
MVKRIAALLLILFLTIQQSLASCIMTVLAVDVKRRPIKDVRFTAIAIGAPSAPTTAEGHTHIVLPVGIKPGAGVELLIARPVKGEQEWVFISPWDGVATMHGPDSYTKIVLALRSEKEILESGDGMRAITQRILARISEATTPKQSVTEEQRRKILVEASEHFGLKPVEIDQAIKAWKERAQDPYDIGIAALYERNYSKAMAQLETSLKLREEQEVQSREKVAEAAFFLGQARYERGWYALSVESYRRAMELRPNDTLTINAYSFALLRAGEYPEAEAVLKRLLKIRENSSGKDHSAVAMSLNSLAWLYFAEGKYPAAERLYKRSREIYENTLGKDHPDVATSLNNLAGLYYAQLKYGDAEALYNRALEIYENALGKDHPNVAASLNNLAEVYRAQGKYPAAERLYKRSREIYENTLGKDHPDVATSLNNLAGLYYAQLKYGDAEALYQRSLEIREKVFGKEHPFVVSSLQNMVCLYDRMGQTNKANQLREQVNKIQSKKQ